MASICDDGNGLKRIQFVGSDGNRRAVRLGKASMKQAEAFKVRLEALIGQSITGAVDDETSRWVAALPDKLHDRLAAVGLVKARNRANMTLGTFLSELFATLDVKPNTLRNYTQARTCLEEYFGAGKALRDIDPCDGDKYRAWLLDTKKLADATVAKWIIIARQVFKRACKWKLIPENPFADVKAGSQTNRERMYFVSRDEAEKVLAACPDAQWRLLFALSPLRRAARAV